MLRSRIAAAAVGVSVLGVTAALVPTVSNAADTTVTAATPSVTWADKASDFTPIAPESDTIPAGWSFVGFSPDSSDDAPTSIDQLATFSASGIAAKDDSYVVLVHATKTVVTPDALPALVAAASATTGAQTDFGLVTADAADPSRITGSTYTESLQGASTTWDGRTGDETTAELVAELKQENEVVIGYAVELYGTSAAPLSSDSDTTEPDATATDPVQTGEQSAGAPTTNARIATPESTLEKLLPAPRANTFALRAAVTPAASGIADLVFGDLTTYFTPEPTAAATATATSLTVTQATTTGYTVSGSGFAPGETVTVGFSQGQSGSELPGTLVANADGAVTGTVVLPSGTTAGTYALVLVGSSSAQTASIAITVTADPAVAPVATPVSGRATFTG
ncbi:hypothetical protein [Curtobacterium sp. 9128]|uniref:hypothetical protein n=1 Tax=Curtobacterium sp. 9128 TaxID=1793722 RepID=UPI0011A007DB|nr:hypothetical protein [Curtobacterium sp. 9128]